MTHPAPSTDFEDIAALMQEPPGGSSHGIESAQSEEFLRDGGWNVVTPKEQRRDAGITAHRGVTHPDEYVDEAVLRSLVASELGFTPDEIDCAYKAGRPTPQRASIRAHIDARLLALSRSGGNMLALARALGWQVDEDIRRSGDANCRTLARALQRARAAEVGAAA